MPSMFIRGNMLSILDTDSKSVSNKGLLRGDTVRVSARKKGGWLRVKCQRTGELMTIRSGRHICLKSEATRPASQIDLLIRESQVASAEERAKVADATIKTLTAERDKLHGDLNATSGLVEDLQERLAYYQNLQQEWHDTLEQAARTQVQLEEQLQQLRADSEAAAAAYHARVSDLEGQLEKLLQAVGEDDWQADMDPGFVPTDEEMRGASWHYWGWEIGINKSNTLN